MNASFEKPAAISNNSFLDRISTLTIVREEWLFFLSYSVFLIFMIFSASFYAVYIDKFWKPVFVFCIILLGMSECVKDNLTWKSILYLAVLGLFFINTLRIAGGISQNSVAGLLLYMFCARDIAFKKIAKTTLCISGVSLLFIVCSAYFGIITNYIAQGERTRKYLGFLYALYGPTLMSNITLLWIWLKKEKIRCVEIIVLVLLNYFFYRETNSRLCFFLGVLALLLSIILKRTHRFFLRRKVLCWIMVGSFIITLIGSYVLTICYNSSVSWMYKLNETLGQRMSLGKESLSQYGIHLFGLKGIKWVGNGLDMYGRQNQDTYLYVDNYYIQIMQRFGMVFLICTILLLTYAAYRSYKYQKDMYLLMILFVLALHFTIDDLYMFPQYNTFWLLIGILTFGREKMRDTAVRRKQI